jgi:hypothetical protein
VTKKLSKMLEGISRALNALGPRGAHIMLLANFLTIGECCFGANQTFSIVITIAKAIVTNQKSSRNRKSFNPNPKLLR